MTWSNVHSTSKLTIYIFIIKPAAILRACEEPSINLKKITSYNYFSRKKNHVTILYLTSKLIDRINILRLAAVLRTLHIYVLRSPAARKDHWDRQTHARAFPWVGSESRVGSGLVAYRLNMSIF